MPAANKELEELDRKVTNRKVRKPKNKGVKSPPLEPMDPNIDTKHRPYYDEPPLPTSISEMEELAASWEPDMALSDDQQARFDHCPIGLGGKAKAIYILSGMTLSQQVRVAQREREMQERLESAQAPTTAKGKVPRAKRSKEPRKPATPLPDGALTARQVADKLGTDPKTLRRFLRQSTFEQTDGKWVFQADQLDELEAAFEGWVK